MVDVCVVLGKNAVCLYGKEERGTGGGWETSRYYSRSTRGSLKLIEETSTVHYHIRWKMKRGLSDSYGDGREDGVDFSSGSPEDSPTEKTTGRERKSGRKVSLDSRAVLSLGSNGKSVLAYIVVISRAARQNPIRIKPSAIDSNIHALIFHWKARPRNELKCELKVISH